MNQQQPGGFSQRPWAPPQPTAPSAPHPNAPSAPQQAGPPQASPPRHHGGPPPYHAGPPHGGQPMYGAQPQRQNNDNTVVAVIIAVCVGIPLLGAMANGFIAALVKVLVSGR